MARILRSATVVGILVALFAGEATAQQGVTYGRWADNPAGCGDTQHSGVVNFEGFVFNKLACRTKTTRTFYGGEERVMTCDIGETKGSEGLLTFVRTSDATLELEMHIFAPAAPINGRIALFACPAR